MLFEFRMARRPSRSVLAVSSSDPPEVRRLSRWIGLGIAVAGLAFGVEWLAAGEDSAAKTNKKWWHRPSSHAGAKVVGRPARLLVTDLRLEEERLVRQREVERLHDSISLIEAKPAEFSLVSDELIPSPPLLTDTTAGTAANRPWWQDELESSTRPTATTLPVSLESLLIRALEHSAQIKVYSDLPLIRETAICEAEAAFDPSAFLESRWDDGNDPVGNSLTTGGSARYQNNQFSGGAGLRQRTRIGGKLEVSQRIGWQDTNSNFFVPDQQGTAKLALSFTQPLMRGRGQVYNESLIVLARIDTEVSEDEFSRQLQSHLLEVARAYWSLYLERAMFVQKQRSLARAEEVRQQLAARAEIDAVASQIQRAEAEVATRQSEFIRAGMAVQNAEDRIRALVNDPILGEDGQIELIPTDQPTDLEQMVGMEESMATAIQMRPEVAQAINQIRASCVRLDMAKNELMPVLNLVTETYMSELQDGGSVGDALTDQFHEGGPGYSVGLQFEVPLGNRAARTRNDRRKMELRQLHNQYETTLKTLNLEVEVAVREVKTSHAEMLAHRTSMQASQSQLDYLEKRWKLLPGDGVNAPLMLDNLLTAQERLVRSESAYVQAWVTYNLSLINHKRATGELLQQQNITWSDYMDECEQVKTRILSKPSLETQYLINPVSIQPDELLTDESQADFESVSSSDQPDEIQASRWPPHTLNSDVTDELDLTDETDETDESIESDAADAMDSKATDEETVSRSAPLSKPSRWKSRFKLPFKR